MKTLQWSWSGRPVWLVTPIVSYMTGMLAALGVAAAHFARLRGLPGQRLHTSGLQAAFALNGGTYVTGPTHQSALLVGGDPRGVYPSYSLYPTADGWLFLGALTQAFWVKLATFLERVDLLVDERLQGNPLTFGAPRCARSCAPSSSRPSPAGRPPTGWRRCVRPTSRAAQCRIARSTCAIPGARRRLPSATFELPPVAASRTARRRRCARPAARRLPAASACSIHELHRGPGLPDALADLGADVVKIETADGDPFRMTAYGFHGWNRGKRSLVLDLKRPEGRDVLFELARQADVVVENSAAA